MNILDSRHASVLKMYYRDEARSTFEDTILLIVSENVIT